MTFRQAIVEAFRRSGASSEFVKAEMNRPPGPFDKAIDWEMKPLPGHSEEEVIEEFTAIFRDPERTTSFANWLQAEVDKHNSKN